MGEKILENARILAGEDLDLVQGYLKIRDGIISEIGSGSPEESGQDMNGSFILPPFVNAHTHLGGSVKKEIYESRSQPEVVGPQGSKFEALTKTSDREKIEAMGESLIEMRDSGIQAHCDFRENGLDGVKLLDQSRKDSIESLILSRPKPGDEIVDLLENSDGIGLPSLESLPLEENEKISESVSEMDKLLSFHVSETEEAHMNSLDKTGKTEIARALEFEPSYLVHGTWATEDDLESISQKDVPLVICSRANCILGDGIPPIKEALDKGVELWIGTDNVSICPPSVFREMSFAWAMLRLQSDSAGSEEARKLLKAATINPVDRLDLPFGPLEDGEKARFTVLAEDHNLKRCVDPYVEIVNRSTESNVGKVFSKNYYPDDPK